MTKEEPLQELQAVDRDDIRVGHQEADQLLLKFINDPEITEIYSAIPKWYA